MERAKIWNWTRLAGLLLAGLGYAGTEIGNLASAGCDATTGASLSVTGLATTLSNATVSWTEKRHNGDRYFCYGETGPSTCAKTSTRNSGVNTQVVSGLKANTKYSFKFYGVYKGSTKSVVTGTFVTDGSGCGTAFVTTVEVQGTLLSASGDSLENAIVKFTNATTNTVAAQDTSDLSGGYFAKLQPGSYKVDISLPPFTAPATINITVIYGKPLTMNNITLSGAFQIGATVTASVKKDTLVGAKVSLTPKAGGTALTRSTDTEGHFTFPVKAGDYLINVTYTGKAMPAPLAVSVTKSMEMPDVVLAGGTGLIHHDRWQVRPAISDAGVNAKGARTRGGKSVRLKSRMRES
jgi:hypothetical protein